MTTLHSAFAMLPSRQASIWCEAPGPRRLQMSLRLSRRYLQTHPSTRRVARNVPSPVYSLSLASLPVRSLRQAVASLEVLWACLCPR